MSQLMDVPLSGVFAPKPKPRQWCSVNGVRFHLEKLESSAAGGQSFIALCGFSGDFNEERFDGETFLQCAECVQISSANIFDVADQSTGNAPVIDGLQVGSSGEATALASPLQSSGSSSIGLEQCPPKARAAGSSPAFPTSLPVPLGREVSGEQRGHCENMVEGVRPFATVPVQFESGYCDGPPADSQSLLVHPAGKTGVGSSARESAPWYFSCVRRGIDGFIADVDRVVDRETAEHQGVSE